MAEVAKSTLRGSGPPKKSWEPPNAEELGRLLPQYRIERLLGRGGMGAVYQGRQVSLDRIVAIKILSNDLEEADASFAERFKNEARAMAKLSHPGIVAVHDFGEVGCFVPEAPSGERRAGDSPPYPAAPLLYIVMEFVEGTDVAKMIAAQKRLHSEHAMAITAHVCDALAYAHERGIIHRDIKPANIMVGYDGVVKVADFGLAKVSASGGETLGLTQSGMAMGTLHFMAPEALMLGSAVDHRADIYAVGVMLYQMLTGKLPHGMFELPSIRVQGLDPRYDGIIARAMREDRDLRYQSAREMRHDLDGILTQPVQRVEPEAAQSIPAALPTEVRPRRSLAGQPYRPPQHSAPLPAKKKSSAGLVLITLGLLAAIGAAMFFLGGNRNAPSGVTVPDDSGQAVSTAATTTLSSATKDKPFINTLGMKFVTVPGTDVMFCIHETRRQDYAVYEAETPGVDDSWKKQKNENIPYGHQDNYPVAGISWTEAQAFCSWLGKKEGKVYRLPTDREWSFAAGIGHDERWGKDTTPETLNRSTKDEYPWGKKWPPPTGSGNYADAAWHDQFPSQKFIEGYNDAFATTAPVMSFKPNSLGLYDLGGNVSEWVEDWWNADQKAKVLRGGSFSVEYRDWLRSSRRYDAEPSRQWGAVTRGHGFRCVMEISSAGNTVSGLSKLTPVEPPNPVATITPKATPPPPSAAAARGQVTKDAPFVNSLGMKFVPVPGTKVLMCIHETRRQDYAAYAQEVPGVDASWKDQKQDGVPCGHEDNHPVVGVSWLDAQAFCEWLSKKDGKTYRLPTDREWSFAIGTGEVEKWTQDATPALLSGKVQGEYPWGTGWPPPEGAGNYADSAYHAAFPADKFIDRYTDGFATTAPVMSFKPNKLGIYDLGGNVVEWVEDWFDATHQDRVQRGNSLSGEHASGMLSSARGRLNPTTRMTTRGNGASLGFRVVLAPVATASASANPTSLPSSTTPSLPAASSLVSATKDAPFTNTLGMKFVPVPGTKVLFCIHETRRQDYEAYAKEEPGVNSMWTKTDLDGDALTGPVDQHPVVFVSWVDAKAYCDWLSRKEGRTYRLPTDEEWSYAAGIGDLESRTKDTTPSLLSYGLKQRWPWGETWPPPDHTANYALEGVDDGYVATAPVMSYEPNRLGIFDLGGNITEWCEDWLGEAEHIRRVVRGGHWRLKNDSARAGSPMLSSWRWGWLPIKIHFEIGFRIVVELPEAAPASSSASKPSPSPSPSLPVSSSSSATKDAPFTNTLGMKFVPVPITGPARSASPSDAGGEPKDQQRVLFSIWETRVQDYEVFVKETGRKAPDPRFQSDFIPGPIHPVTAVNWEDASAFCAWLTERGRKAGLLPATESYRLPSDHEWSCAVGIGSREDAAQPPSKKNRQIAEVFPWGTAWPPPEGVENLAGEELQPLLDGGLHPYIKQVIPGYRDSFTELAPVGSFKPNALGLHDLGGNVAEWCEDWMDAARKFRALRGATWLDHERGYIGSSMRPSNHPTDSHFNNYGFRVVLAPVAASESRAAAP